MSDINPVPAVQPSTLDLHRELIVVDALQFSNWDRALLT